MDESKVLERSYVQEIISVIREHISDPDLPNLISDYHDNDIAGAFEELTKEERKQIYPVLGAERVSEIFSYIEDAHEYLKELNLEKAAKVVSYMDSDDAVDVLEEMDDTAMAQIVELMDKESSEDIRLILSYDEDEIGSKMTTNYIEINNTLTVREAMKELISQAGKNDNISTVYGDYLKQKPQKVIKPSAVKILNILFYKIGTENLRRL